ncbi:hypothetical protein C4564_04025 [Candidatus Microgenomates bacterium]|nr:MAG: hypothetical protein C4564_04025 [Candidatus Microgenomates bacterium]
MSERVVGYILLTAGVVVIAFSAFNIYGVFTRAVPPVSLFNFPAISVPSSALLGGLSVEGTNLPIQVKSTDIELLSSDMINQTSNVLAHLVLMGFIASIGSRLSMIGVSLVKRIEVKVKPSQPTNG